MWKIAFLAATACRSFPGAAPSRATSSSPAGAERNRGSVAPAPPILNRREYPFETRTAPARLKQPHGSKPGIHNAGYRAPGSETRGDSAPPLRPRQARSVARVADEDGRPGAVRAPALGDLAELLRARGLSEPVEVPDVGPHDRLLARQRVRGASRPHDDQHRVERPDPRQLLERGDSFVRIHGPQTLRVEPSVERRLADSPQPLQAARLEPLQPLELT